MKIKQLIPWPLRHPVKWFKLLVVQVKAHNAIAARKLQHPGCEHALNAWPPTSGSGGFDVDGDTTIKWGTVDLLQSPTATGTTAHVLRCSQKELVDVSYLPNGSGVNVSRVRIKQGGNWTITVRDRSGITWPKIGGTVSIVDMSGHIGTIGLQYTATVVDNDYEATLKNPGERTLLVEKMTLIETGSGSSQA